MPAVDSLTVTVCDGATSYRRGLGAVLSAAGFVVEAGDDLISGIVSDGVHAVLCTLRSAADWQVLSDLLAAGPHLTVVALLVDPTPDRYAEAFRCGAHGVAAWEAPPEAIAGVLAAAIEGSAILPIAVTRAIASCGPALHDPDWVTSEELEWLKLLAEGATVLQVANKAGYSERALYRLLHGLYGRMRVANRTEAILQASRWGLLER